jgi:hypothetical protein
MVREANIIHVEPDSELGRLLDRANGTPVRLEKDGIRYTLSRGDADLLEDYDPEHFRKVLDEVAGSISPEEAAEMIEYIYRAREEGSRDFNRP